MTKQEAEDADKILEFLKNQTNPVVAQDIQQVLGVPLKRVERAVAVIDAHDPSWIIRERVTYTRDSYVVNREMTASMAVWKDFGGFTLAFYNQGQVAAMNEDRKAFFEKHLPRQEKLAARPSGFFHGRYATPIKIVIGLILLVAGFYIVYRYRQS